MEALTPATGVLLNRIVQLGDNGLYRPTRDFSYYDTVGALVRRGLVRVVNVGKYSSRVFAIEPQASQALKNRPLTWYEYERRVAAEERRRSYYTNCGPGLRAVPHFSE